MMVCNMCVPSFIFQPNAGPVLQLADQVGPGERGVHPPRVNQPCDRHGLEQATHKAGISSYTFDHTSVKNRFFQC